jgi:hypothetical protein
MLIEADWDKLEQVLRDCVPVNTKECAYLKKAFVETERMWGENFARVTTVRLVMLSESPLFGTDERYFYNAATRFGSFFYFQDTEAILGHGFAKGHRCKEFLLPALARAGFIILDLFPFALNRVDTPSITYGRMPASRYRDLFQRTARFYFDRKRDLILEHGTPLFLFRYGRLHQRLGDLVDAELAKRNIGSAQSIGGTNMSLDREKLRRICQAAHIVPGCATHTEA